MIPNIALDLEVRQLNTLDEPLLYRIDIAGLIARHGLLANDTTVGEGIILEVRQRLAVLEARILESERVSRALLERAELAIERGLPFGAAVLMH
jgi:hypothetical protein